MGTKSCTPSWEIDLVKFRKYLQYKYNVDEAYYFLGYVQNENEELYDKIQKAGYILKFREHNPAMLGTKKGNVDSDIIFYVMKKLYLKEKFEKIVLVSGDGDYKMLVDFLIEQNRFAMLLFPNKKFASSLYKKMKSDCKSFLEDKDVRKKIS
jgi:uncharacterized LabA/DUF88 family protein